MDSMPSPSGLLAPNATVYPVPEARRARMKRPLEGQPLHAHGPLESVLEQGGLYPVYQPIVSLTDASIHAHEALIRGPRGTALHTPDALLRAAAQECLGFEFEYACLVAALRNWGQMKVPGRLFVNVSAAALMQLVHLRGSEPLLELMSGIGILPRMLVLEITERASVAHDAALNTHVQRLRALGFRLAVDDLGAGYAGLTTLARVQPEFVKLDGKKVTSREELVTEIQKGDPKKTVTIVREGKEMEFVLEWPKVAAQN